MRSFFRALSIVLLITWMIVIFDLSHQTATVSSQTSGKVIEAIAEKVYPYFEDLTDDEKQEVVSSFQFAARKTAHVGTYFILGVFAFLTFVSYVGLRFFTRNFWAFIVASLYAASDEFHQHFIEGRSCELRDFLLDVSGILVALIVCTIFTKSIRILRYRTAYIGKSKKELKELNTELFEKLDDTYHEKVQLEKQLEEKVATISDQEKVIETLEKELNEQEIEAWAANAQSVQQQNKVEIEELETSDQIVQPECEEEIEELETSDQIVQPRNEPETEEAKANFQSVQLRNEEENKMEKEINLSDEMQYAASAIGKVVVEVTKVCNKLGDFPDEENKKELINLALGRSEVFKSQVLQILASETDFDTKKNMIEQEKSETFDYFNSIIAQMC